MFYRFLNVFEVASEMKLSLDNMVYLLKVCLCCLYIRLQTIYNLSWGMQILLNFVPNQSE